MIHFGSFILGTISGMYIAQNYDISDVKSIGDKIIDYLNSIEKFFKIIILCFRVLNNLYLLNQIYLFLFQLEFVYL